MAVLIIEDEAMIARLVADFLEDLGHQVHGMAASVEEALAVLAPDKPKPDVAILDLNLGGEPADPVAHRLREVEIPFLIATGYGEDRLDRSGLHEPAIYKPYSQAALGRALADLNSRSPAA